DIVLDLDPRSDAHVIADEDVLSHHAILANDRAAADVAEMPDPRSGTDHRARVDDGGRLDLHAGTASDPSQSLLTSGWRPSRSPPTTGRRLIDPPVALAGRSSEMERPWPASMGA